MDSFSPYPILVPVQGTVSENHFLPFGERGHCNRGIPHLCACYWEMLPIRTAKKEALRATGLDSLGCASYGCHQFLNWWPQMPTGHLHLMGPGPHSHREKRRLYGRQDSIASASPRMDASPSSRGCADAHRASAFDGSESLAAPKKERPTGPLFFWCGRQDSNLHAFALEPKSNESTNSTTPAFIKLKVESVKWTVSHFSRSLHL